MRVKYYQDTDSLYIDLLDQPGIASQEITAGVVLDFDAVGNLVGIDIDQASTKVALDKLIVSCMPGTVETEAA